MSRVLFLFLVICIGETLGFSTRSSASSRRAVVVRPSPFRHGSFDKIPTRSVHSFPQTRIQLSLLSIDLPLIAADDAWGNWAVLTGTATAAQVLGRKTAIGRLLGPPVSAMAMTFLFATIGVLNPGGTEAAKSLQLLSLQLATPLILLGADLRDAGRRCGPLLFSFAVASMATVIACLIGWQLVGTALTAALGRDGLVIAAALLAKNVGGGINYVAVCRSLGASPTAVAAGLCVDNIFALVYFPITSALAARLPDIESTETVDTNAVSLSLVDNDNDDSAVETTAQSTSAAHRPEIPATETFSVQNITAVVSLSALLLWLGEKIGGTAGALPVCTILTVALASKAPTQWMTPLQPAANALGTVGLYLFFATAGAPGIAVADSVRASLVPLSIFLTCLYAVHGLILAACWKLGRKWFPAFEPQRLLVASSAAIGGPATSVALAQAASWESLTVPSLLVGNIGYAIATFCGLAYHALFQCPPS